MHQITHFIEIRKILNIKIFIIKTHSLIQIIENILKIIEKSRKSKFRLKNLRI